MDSAPPGFVQGQIQCTEVADPFDRPQQRFFCTTGQCQDFYSDYPAIEQHVAVDYTKHKHPTFTNRVK
jgi:hypothetical protein